jgi:SAM-dependent methyltransferase
LTISAGVEAIHKAKEGGYFSAVREDLLELVAGRDLSILEIGAGTGATLSAAKSRGIAARAIAVELIEPRLRAERIDEFVIGSIEDLDLSSWRGSIDVVLIGDVLEHLVDPWATVDRLRELLKPDGQIVCSLPNMRNFRLLRKLVLRGDFTYEPAGLMDVGHLRFFCRRNAIELFERAGLRVVRVAENMGGYGWAHRLLDLVTFRLFHEFFVFQYRIVARKP